MPKRLVIARHLSCEELWARHQACQNVPERLRWQAIALLAGRTPSEYVSNATGFSAHWIRTLARRYNEQGPEALRDGRHQLPGPKRLLSPEQQGELAQALAQEVPDELGGGLWNGPKVAAWMSRCLGRVVHKRRGHDYLVLLGYSCQTPRPRHQKADPQCQELFKKHSRTK
jgi:transposase